MASQDLSASLNILRARVEAEIAVAPSLAVVSARADDGAEMLAHLLGRTFAQSGQSTVVLEFGADAKLYLTPDAAPGDAGMRAKVAASLLAGGSGYPDVLPIYLGEESSTWSAEQAQSLVATLGRRYRRILFASAEPMRDAQRLLWLGLADRCVIALRRGRTKCAADRQLRDLFEGSAAVIGTVAIEPRLMRTFDPSTPGGADAAVPTVRGEHRLAPQFVESR